MRLYVISYADLSTHFFDKSENSLDKLTLLYLFSPDKFFEHESKTDTTSLGQSKVEEMKR